MYKKAVARRTARRDSHGSPREKPPVSRYIVFWDFDGKV
jgi:hypothetical protein